MRSLRDHYRPRAGETLILVTDIREPLLPPQAANRIQRAAGGTSRPSHDQRGTGSEPGTTELFGE